MLLAKSNLLSSPSIHNSFNSYQQFTTTSENSIRYEDVAIIKILGKTKSPVYLGTGLPGKRYFAIQVFTYTNDEANSIFKNKARFGYLNHSNIIEVLHVEEETSMVVKDQEKNVSCILMEFAPYGNIFDFVLKYKHLLTETLIRTYFYQLIEVIDEIHNQGIWHLDIKPENLLIGNGYQLKVNDFSHSYMKGDKCLVSKGTRFFRAPEIRYEKCIDGTAADIYSAGCILFLLKTGGVIPHAEGFWCNGVDLL